MKNVQIERALQHEVMLQLHSAEVRGHLACVYYPIPNGVFLPARTPAERTMVARVIHQLKIQGAMVPGAPDLVFLAAHAGGAIELKRPETRTLLQKFRRGELSPKQLEQRDRINSMGIRWAVCSTWEEVRSTLVEWGMYVAV